MAVSAITLAEVIHGAEKNKDPARNLSVVEDFFARLVLPPTRTKRRGTMTTSVQPWKKRVNRSTSTTCLSPRMRAAKV